MRWLAEVLLVLPLAGSVHAAQIPFHLKSTASKEAELSLPVDVTSTNWDLNVKPSVNSTSHLIFDTVSAFLQHWPNTRYRNGHNLVPGIVPVGTLLYHGRGDSNLPTVPEWTATDPEHANAFCRGSQETGCWQVTLVSTRPLNVLYFDGSSAAKMKGGPMDTQDIVAWRKLIPEWMFNEGRRLADLCVWGQKFGVDGFVRMEMDFEIMLCDFTVGVDVVSFLNLVSNGRGPRGGGGGSPGGPGGPPPGGPPGKDSMEGPSPADPSASTDAFSEVIHSGSWHNRYPGETRIQLDLARMISFYDTSLVPSLVPYRFNQERWFHRLEGVSDDDISAVMDRLEQAMQTAHGGESGVDWTTLVHVIVDRYGDRLEMVQYLLNSTGSPDSDGLRAAKRVQTQLKVMVQPYQLHSVVPPSLPSDDHSWASPIFKLCATTHTSYIAKNKLTRSEHLILESIDETNREICRVVTRMWAQGVVAGLDDAPTPMKLEDSPSSDLLPQWKTQINDLMAWLDWSVWVKCRPDCGFEEYCYLPTWPFFGRGGGGPPGRGPNSPGGPGQPPTRFLEDVDDWEKPQPRCIRKIEPFDM
ncbi:uncharacterized protein BT62DRAFT_929654 [Guyanagaster necrorhizus]|uniref:Uncharacterized protein n=1 Tax=Guyanagaster necrorhizus TaxID=856835 RepID=A0A9P7VXT0_9AGAR|nr:uncharacterized protein BT62DRAFT_929654 [Guyanagaster necrorhizus MCA 3950]KAG7448568.1 hypothetical protein BT62DRAFT_929654 [Guyanagaster necrorhizus MCA 3950]